MAGGSQDELLQLIERLLARGDLSDQTREELGWIADDAASGSVAGDDERYVHALAEELEEEGARRPEPEETAPRAAPRTGKTIRLCFVGDSITNGTGDETFLGWPGRLCLRAWDEGHDVTLHNLGIRGDTSELIEKRWKAECTARLPADVPAGLVFAFGVNDTAVAPDTGIRVPLERSLEISRRILSEARDWLPTVWIGPAPVPEHLQPVNPRPGVCYDFRNARIEETAAAYARLADELGVPFLDLYAALKDEPRWTRTMNVGDGVHPTTPGYELLADIIGGWEGWKGLLR